MENCQLQYSARALGLWFLTALPWLACAGKDAAPSAGGPTDGSADGTGDGSTPIDGSTSVEQVVTSAEGGTLETGDGRFALTLPAGALGEDTAITIRTVAEPDGIGGVAYELSPDGLELEQPATVTFTAGLGDYTDGGDDIVGVPLVRSSSGAEEVLKNAATEVDYFANRITTTGELSHFSIVINTNVASLNAQRQLMSTQITLQKSFERLSSGLRINAAADDAAALAVSETLRAQIRSFSVAERNTNNAVSLTQVCEGGLAEVSGIVLRLRELALANNQPAEATASQLRLEDDDAAPLGSLFFSVVGPAVCGDDAGLPICPHLFDVSMPPEQVEYCPRLDTAVAVSGSFLVSAAEAADAYNLQVTLATSHPVRPLEVLLKLHAGDRKLWVAATEGPDGSAMYAAFTVFIATGQPEEDFHPQGMRTVSGDETTWTIDVPDLPGTALLAMVDQGGVDFTDDACFGHASITLPDWGTCPW